MKKLTLAFAFLAALSLPALADPNNGNGNKNGWNNPNNPHYSGGSGDNVHGAPGPIAGAGLPILAVGYGVYWLIRRRRKAQ
jgi:hypothetical protein